ncbi:hypothetical protein L7F22_045515 [Adiantum nelumboides]|nr:hypothetical protein [Adiantum nelumboides]
MAFQAGKPPKTTSSSTVPMVWVAYALTQLQQHIPESLLKVRALRTDIKTRGALNDGCGADYVKTNQRLPLGLEKEKGIEAGQRLCSYDGDADRIVYYYLRGPPQQKESFRLLDGDKIASLAADHLNDLVKRAGVAIEVGCVQTAYAMAARQSTSSRWVVRFTGAPIVTVEC